MGKQLPVGKARKAAAVLSDPPSREFPAPAVFRSRVPKKEGLVDAKAGLSRSGPKRSRWRSALGIVFGTAALVAVVLLLASPALAPPASFPDVPAPHPYHDAIIDLADRGIITGFTDGTFGPEGLVVRQQFAKMIVLTLDLPVSASDVSPFTDVDKGGLYPDAYVAVAASHGITVGTGPGLFSPWAKITRAQVVTMIVRGAQNVYPSALVAPPAGYSGTLGDFDPTHAGNMKIAEFNGLLAGLQGFGASWNPFASATRGEVAQMLHNLLGKLPVTSTTTTTGATTTTTSGTTTTTTVPLPAYENLGGELTSGPAAVSWGPNRIDTFVSGPGNNMYHKWWNGAAWSGWENLGGELTSGPAVCSWAPNRLDTFVRGPANALWHKWWNGAAWSGWENLGGVLASGPAAVSWGSNRIDVFMRGTDNALWHKWWNGSAWLGWESPGGVFTLDPAVSSWGSGRLDVFARGSANQLLHRWYDGTWHP